MCRDGSVVPANNFDIPENCPLVTIVDGEVVIRRKSGKQRGVVSVLNAFDRFMNLGDNPSFKFFNKFDQQTNLLFEVSTAKVRMKKKIFESYIFTGFNNWIGIG